MNFFELVEKRRSIRRFSSEPIPPAFVEKALDAAILAPNSSNTQTWDFYWVKSPERKLKLIQYCLNQSAARTAAELVVIVADPKKWKRSYKPLNDFVISVKAPKLVLEYFKKLIPLGYTWGFLNSFALVKWLFVSTVGLFRPITRGPNSKREVQLVAVKSAALAAENFVLALTAQGVDTCMMEGNDEWRVKRLLKLPLSARVVMVIGIGYGTERGTWGPRFRIPKAEVVHII